MSNSPTKAYLDEPLREDCPSPHFNEVLAVRMSRRQLMKGSMAAATATLFGTTLTACVSDSDNDTPAVETPAAPGFSEPKLGFQAVAVTRADTTTVPAGYTATPFLPLGTPICGTYPEYKPDGTNTGAEQEQQMGMCHDGMHFFPIGGSSTHGLLVMNHEYIVQPVLHANGATTVGGIRTVPDEVRKEIAAHGVAVVEIRSTAHGQWEIVRGAYNRRITGATPMAIRGPVRGHEKVRTKYSPDGTRTRGTLNNCAHGYTPWNTYLTCEENWAGYFVNKTGRPREHSRYGVATSSGRYRWETVAGDEYERFDVSVKAASASEDYRNEVNGFGWVVEIDPFDPDSTPIKRTALGRFAHEGCVYAPVVEGRPVVFYMGDDSQNEYIYKFVTRANYSAATANGSMLDDGTLYVARFDADGSGRWLALDFNNADFLAACLAKGVSFSDQGDVLLNTRLAAATVNATPMNRPEWGAVHPHTGEVYFTLTNNSSRTVADAANPRAPNPYGHIVRWRETGNDAAALSFEWDIFVLSGTLTDSGKLGDATQPLGEDAIHASPDGLWIDPNGILWIQTDMSGSQQGSGPFGENQMLAAEPATGEIRRFYVGPREQEVTGVITTPDGKTMFVNNQHPGDRSTPGNFTSNWPDRPQPYTTVDPSGPRPRCATVIITRNDGGVIGL
ncbi:PhoX family protein [Thauera mechernichensis]